MTTSGSGSVVLAGGGTAGHTSPLIATGLELRRLGDGVTVTALGTARGLETSVVPAAGLQLELIPPGTDAPSSREGFCFAGASAPSGGDGDRSTPPPGRG